MQSSNGSIKRRSQSERQGRVFSASRSSCGHCRPRRLHFDRRNDSVEAAIGTGPCRPVNDEDGRRQDVRVPSDGCIAGRQVPVRDDVAHGRAVPSSLGTEYDLVIPLEVIADRLTHQSTVESRRRWNFVRTSPPTLAPATDGPIWD